MFSVPLSQMSRVEKLQAMEALWQDLAEGDQFESPAWHGLALRETERAVKEGKADFIEWEKAKKLLRERKA
jgi:hypothetical protein